MHCVIISVSSSLLHCIKLLFICLRHLLTIYINIPSFTLYNKAYLAHHVLTMISNMTWKGEKEKGIK